MSSFYSDYVKNQTSNILLILFVVVVFMIGLTAVERMGDTGDTGGGCAIPPKYEIGATVYVAGHECVILQEVGIECGERIYRVQTRDEPALCFEVGTKNIALTAEESLNIP